LVDYQRRKDVVIETADQALSLIFLVLIYMGPRTRRVVSFAHKAS